MKDASITPVTFTTFGDLLKYLRKRVLLTQRELAIAVGYSEAQISRLENNRFPPESSRLAALFIPALQLEDEPELTRRLVDLAKAAHAEAPAQAPTSWTERLLQPKSNLPVQLTSFVGRRNELMAVCELLNQPGTRLLTLTGAGGCGKTRLALRAGETVFQAYGDGIWLVELASIMDPALVTQCVIRVLGLLVKAGEPPETALIRFLKERHLLLILDNCEHLVEKCAALTETLLRNCPDLQILATSRESLRMPGEVLYRVPSLSLPPERDPAEPTCKEISESEAVQLFVERARLTGVAFCLAEANAGSIARLCGRLDGIPLAIELAAARIQVMPPQQIAAHLDDIFTLLTGGSRTVLPRQRTLRAALDWSHDLLSKQERKLFRRLSVFIGGWDLADAEAVCCDAESSARAKDLIHPNDVLDVLASLAGKSMVIVDEEQRAEARYRFSQPIQQYAREKLVKAGELAEIRKRHLDHFRELGETAEQKLKGREQADWYERLERNLENIRQALTWGLETDPTAAMRLATALFMFWFNMHQQEGIGWLEACVQKPENAAHTVYRLRALGVITNIGMDASKDNGKKLEEWEREALEISHELGDKDGEAWARKALALMAFWKKEDFSNVKAGFDKALELFRAAGDQWGEARTLMNYSALSLWSGEYEAAKKYAAQSVKESQEIEDYRQYAFALTMEADVIGEFGGELARARELYERAISILRGLKLFTPAMEFEGMVACIEYYQGDFASARDLLDKQIVYFDQVGDTLSAIQTNHSISRDLIFQGLFAQGIELIEKTFSRLASMFPQDPTPHQAIYLPFLAYAYMNLGQLERARETLEQFTKTQVADYYLAEIELWTRARIAFQEGNAQEAARNSLESLKIGCEMKYKMGLLPGLEAGSGALYLLGHFREAARCLAAVNAARKACGAPTFPSELPYLQHVREGLLAKMEEADFLRAWEEGNKMPFDQAVEEALLLLSVK